MMITIRFFVRMFNLLYSFLFGFIFIHEFVKCFVHNTIHTTVLRWSNTLIFSEFEFVKNQSEFSGCFGDYFQSFVLSKFIFRLIP